MIPVMRALTCSTHGVACATHHTLPALSSQALAVLTACSANQDTSPELAVPWFSRGTQTSHRPQQSQAQTSPPVSMQQPLFPPAASSRMCSRNHLNSRVASSSSSFFHSVPYSTAASAAVHQQGQESGSSSSSSMSSPAYEQGLADLLVEESTFQVSVCSVALHNACIGHEGAHELVIKPPTEKA